MAQHIGNSIQDVQASPEAAQTVLLLEKLKDIDGNRIAKDDYIVIRKGVLGLLDVVARLEGRIGALEAERAAR
ncbi:hypothetical protein E1281_04885 [Actinomadura sp. KC345]|uniref:hypothetical protein n=1 Tax=Actinomadura sp. KC345 TaxID=2530371 RepID=UPI001044E83A|nr:hypothetical protein [Actinomadura sp. KC345]TDC57430.1 hypothetical protein E1281_04885 [Actinomadura sp. KC345]